LKFQDNPEPVLFILRKVNIHQTVLECITEEFCSAHTYRRLRTDTGDHCRPR